MRLSLDLTGLIVVIAVGVLLPVVLMTAVGIVALAIADDAGGLVTGVLVVSFAAAALGSALIAVVLAGRKARLARRQADFVAGVSHEFKTPLSAIRLYAQTLQSGGLAGDPQTAARCLETILRETEWLDAMVDRVLSWRAASHNRLPLRFETTPVADAVGQAVERFRALADPHGLVLDVRIDTQRPIRHDRAGLVAVLLNLLTNALKVTGADKRIGLTAVDTQDGVCLEVSDNGPGLEPAEQKRVFQPFYRVRRTAGGGAGLGLAISRHVVERHGGSLEVRSRPGEGAVFSVRLPAGGPA